MIIFARHGNTFEPGAPASWVGAKSDLPLVAEGYNQAKRVAAYLQTNGITPKSFIAGPLKRTRSFAEVVASTFESGVEIDPDLKELDYGEWEGLDNSTVAQRFGADVLSSWEEGFVWPAKGGWGESAEIVGARIEAVLRRLSSLPQPVFACTSNGILRFVRFIVDGERQARSTKVKTGALCIIETDVDGLRVREWNHTP